MKSIPALPQGKQTILEEVMRDYSDFDDTESDATRDILAEALQNSSPFGERLPEYQYSPLPNANYTRVIVLHPSVSTFEVLRCNIIFMDLENKPSTYDALSYAWGDHEVSEAIHCNGSYIGITKHLAGALRRFRSTTMPRKIWVDAVCINQNDDEEKAQHIHLMSAIYQLARCVLVYLGEPKLGQELYLLFLHELVSLVGGLAEATVDTHRNNVHIRQALKKTFGREDIALAGEFTKLSWFTRRWVIQEASLCEVAVVFFGRSIAPLEMITVALSALSNSSLVSDKLDQGAVDNLRTISYVRNHRQQSAANLSIGILDLLVNCHASKTSDPRDRLYALLPLAPDVNTSSSPDFHDQSIALRADYRKSVGDIYVEFAMECLQKSTTLDILHCAGAFRRRPISVDGLRPVFGNASIRLPSFVPDWASQRRHIPLRGIDRFKSGFCNKYPSRDLQKIPLQIPGIVLDVVRAKTPKFSDVLLFEEALQGAVHAIQLYETYLCSTHINIDDLERIGRTLIADHALTYSTILLISGARLPTEELKEEHSMAERRKLAMVAGFHAILKDYQVHDGKVSFDQMGNTSIISLAKLHYMRTLCETMQGRSFLVSDRGYIGIAPDDCVVGDTIAIPYGARTPFILRFNPTLGYGVWQIIGDCYVDGFMNGEAFQVQGLEIEDLLIS
ncbi:hypothetical protein FE257_012937 [Aspergillus nanangensis]|uniref:Heterokaryon incompatibility domain-containing protein n=1 Tax=Aspergillus nanangensis TaxID=2582783 RepID=A0AAD4GQF2_ASPNN|nr:hypothetical protein FE257_012937 [Aspergillus nanangensis]